MPALIPLLLLAQVASAPASDPCQRAAPMPPELVGWSAMRPIAAATSLADTNRTDLPLGKGIRATLSPDTRVTYAIKPEKAGASGMSGGLFRFDIARAGRYRIALGASAWIDVISNGAPLPSVAHVHGPACSAVRKMVDFDLPAGRYTLQVSNSRTSMLTLMVVALAR